MNVYDQISNVHLICYFIITGCITVYNMKHTANSSTIHDIASIAPLDSINDVDVSGSVWLVILGDVPMFDVDPRGAASRSPVSVMMVTGSDCNATSETDLRLFDDGFSLLDCSRRILVLFNSLLIDLITACCLALSHSKSLRLSLISAINCSYLMRACWSKLERLSSLALGVSSPSYMKQNSILQ